MWNCTEAAYAVSIGEKPDAGHDHQASMVPSKGCLINLREGQTSPLVRIHNVRVDALNILIGGIANPVKA